MVRLGRQTIDMALFHGSIIHCFSVASLHCCIDKYRQWGSIEQINEAQNTVFHSFCLLPQFFCSFSFKILLFLYSPIPYHEFSYRV